MSYGMIWLITGLVMVLSYIVQARLNSRFDEYSQVPTSNGMTGADVARKMLADNGITDVQVTCVPGIFLATSAPVIPFEVGTCEYSSNLLLSLACTI